MRVAAIDIGTNTALMLIAEKVDDSIKVIRDEHSIPRLGEDVDKTKKIGDAAIIRLDEILTKYRKIVDEEQVDEVYAVGTSALRDAANSREVCDHVKKEFDIQVRLITGEEESRLTYQGAISDSKMEDTLIGVIDIGGGSTEIALGRAKNYVFGKSMDVGAVRLTERTQDRSKREQLIREYLKSNFHIFPLPNRMVAVAGTATSVAAIKLGLQTFDKEKINGIEVSIEELERLVDIISTISAEELTKRYPSIPKGRADILPSGTLILLEVLRYFRMQSVTVSIRGLRYGIAIDALAFS